MSQPDVNTNVTSPDTPAAPTTDPVPTAGAQTVEELQAQVAELQARLEAASGAAAATAPADVIAAPSTTTTTTTTAADEAEVLPAHALAPGSAGEAVKELAQLVESAGEKTYLSEGGNVEHVFFDDLLAAVKRILSKDVRANAAIEEVELRLRDVALISHVTGEVWQTLRRLAAAKGTPAA